MTWRGLPEWILAEAGVQVFSDGLVIAPYRLADGRLWADHFIAPNGRRWWEPGDGRSVIPFGLEALEAPRYRRYRLLVICEGESDSLAVRAALGAEGVDALGIPGSSTWRPSWAESGAGYSAVYVAGDGDEAGRALSDRVLADLRGVRLIRLPPGEDARSVIQRDGPEAFLGLMDEADRLADFIEALQGREVERRAAA